MAKRKRAYRSPKGRHRHKCTTTGCGFVWEHSDSCGGDTAAHTCPGCGQEEWLKYHGSKPPGRRPRARTIRRRR